MSKLSRAVFHNNIYGTHFEGYIDLETRTAHSWPTIRTEAQLIALIDSGTARKIEIPIADNAWTEEFHPAGVWEDSFYTTALNGKTTTTKKEEELVTSPTWEIVDAVLNHSRRVLLMGPPGTGKTYAATRRGMDKRTNDRVYSVTMTPETPAAEMRGHYVPKAGEMQWQDGPAIRAWREGARLVINEIDHSSPDCLSLLFAVLDDPEFAEFTLPTGETVRPVDGFQIVATMNGEPEDLPPALQDRFPVTLEIMELNPEAIASLPDDLQYVVRNTALHASEERRISIRAWAEFANLRKRMRLDYGNKDGLELAAQAVFGPRASEALNALAMAEDAA